MAKLFLSYSRKDEAKARRFTQWLERDGHDVWRDEDDIGGGASFSQEIEEALKDSEAVLVLWSADSVKSAWVRDEAGYGRDAGKLIPFSLDGTEPPLGFRQFQSINLSRWKGHRDTPDAERIRHAIARVAGVPHREPAAARPVRRGWRDKLAQKPVLLAGSLAIVAAASAGAFYWQRWSGDRQIAIAVLPSPRSPDRAMAADYANVAAADMAAFLPRRFDRATVIGPDDASGGRSAYRMLISIDPHGAGANATLTLADQDSRTTLWSKNWSVADATAADLKAGVSAAASKAAQCLTDARGGSERLSQPALSLYLSGCTGLGETNLSNSDFETMFERVIKLAPGFAPAWDYLALSRAWIAQQLQDDSPAAYAAAVKSARDAIANARRLNPGSAMSYDAEYHLITNDTFRALRVLNAGAKVDPDDGRIQMHLSKELRSVGRMADSVQAAQTAVNLEPGSPYVRAGYILALTNAGLFSKAKVELAAAREKWPHDPTIDYADFNLQYDFGDPRAALPLLPAIVSSDAEMDTYKKYLAARQDPSPEKIDGAIAAVTASTLHDRSGQNAVASMLANLGRTDQAYQLLSDPKFQPVLQWGLLFRPDFAKVRADPRFMQVAAKLGLVRYWRQTGNWPDFCTTDKLKYDCETEAAKYK